MAEANFLNPVHPAQNPPARHMRVDGDYNTFDLRGSVVVVGKIRFDSMASVMGWYGPLVDLSRASSHIGHFVQLLVLVHRCTPVQYKLSKGGEVIRTDIQVGDDTSPFFSVSLWHKQMAALAVSGDVILLQNVKIAKFGDVIEARTTQFSCLQCLVHPFESLISKDADELMEVFRGGEATIEKLQKVIKWAKRAGSTIYNMRSISIEKRHFSRNWKVPEQQESKSFFFLSEVLHISNSCEVIFNASVGEIFLPITWRALGDFEKGKMFISRRVTNIEDSGIAEDLICIGCQLCGSPMSSKENEFISGKISTTLYCPKSKNHFHVVGLIYRPFMLYVWDESEYLPLLVRNNAAELLFGNIRAERVHSFYKGEKDHQHPNKKDAAKENMANRSRDGGTGCSCSSTADERLEGKEKKYGGEDINCHLIWLIILKMLLRCGNNSPLRFEVTINADLEIENGKFEMASVSIPCTRTK